MAYVVHTVAKIEGRRVGVFMVGLRGSRWLKLRRVYRWSRRLFRDARSTPVGEQETQIRGIDPSVEI